jgi:hypothetical protein
MRARTGSLTLALLGLGAAACTPNAATFYEGTRFAFVTEYNPASGEPLNLTLGYKRRIAAIVPPQNPTKESDGVHKGESLSLVSTFEVEPGASIGDGVTIRNVFASGMAARDLTKPGNARENVQSLFAKSSVPPLSPELLRRRDALVARLVAGNLTNDQADAMLKAAGLRPVPPARCQDRATEAVCTLQSVLSKPDEKTLEKLESASVQVIFAPARP